MGVLLKLIAKCLMCEAYIFYTYLQLMILYEVTALHVILEFFIAISIPNLSTAFHV